MVPRSRSVEVRSVTWSRPGCASASEAAAALRSEGHGGAAVYAQCVGRKQCVRRLRAAREQRARDALAIDRRRERTPHAHVCEQTSIGAREQVGEVRAATRVHMDAGRVLERGQKRGREPVHDEIGATRMHPKRTRVLVVHGAERDVLRGGG